MKLKLGIIIAILCMAIMQVNAQEIKTTIDTVKIQTSAKCNDCKERLEHNISFEKGVKSVELDNETKILTVVYKTAKTNEEKIKIAITKVGYDADEMPADQKAHDRLPACCQKGADPH